VPPGWLRTKRIGRGVRPTSWQGRALTGIHVLLAIVLARTLVARPVALLPIALVVLTSAYAMVAGLTGRGRR
jgi:hypothetical protein